MPASSTSSRSTSPPLAISCRSMPTSASPLLALRCAPLSGSSSPCSSVTPAPTATRFLPSSGPPPPPARPPRLSMHSVCVMASWLICFIACSLMSSYGQGGRLERGARRVFEEMGNPDTAALSNVRAFFATKFSVVQPVPAESIRLSLNRSKDLISTDPSPSCSSPS